MRSRLIFIVVCVLLLVASFLGGYHCHSIRSPLVESDTISRIDTIQAPIPYPEIQTEIDIEMITLPEYITLLGDTIHDTIYVNLPVTQKEYKTDLYHAYVSGYKPQLDSIMVYRPTQYITQKVYQRRYGIGLIGGYGVGIQGLTPFIGVGCFYRIW